MVRVTRKGLALFDISLPDSTDENGLKEVYADDVKTIQRVVPTYKDVEKLKDLPFCSDDSVLNVMKL